MRRICYLAMLLTLATIVGCQKNDELYNVQNNVGKTFYASTENGVDTRTALDNKNNVIWSEGDQISVFSGNTINNAFILNEGAGTTYGKFTESLLSAGTESNGSIISLSANVAYYPYDNNVTVIENDGSYIFNATFPAIQTFSESGNFGNGASPMVAVTSSLLDANLKFKNVGAIFRLLLTGEAKITKVVFSADANLAGECNITASNSSSPTVDVIEGSNSITLDCGNGVQLSSDPTNFIVAMLPFENVTSGITITIFDNVGKKMVYTHKADEPITIERSKAYSTAEVTYSGNENALPLTAQEALDNATNGTIIQLEPGVNYGTLVFRQNAFKKVVDITNAGGDAAGNEKYSKYENITILGAPGATVDQIDFEVGWIDNSGASYIDIKNLTVKNVTFSGEKTAFNMEGKKGSALGIDGLTIENCTMNDANGNDRFVFQQISGYKELIDKSTGEYVMTAGIKNLTIKGCEVTGAYMVIESRTMQNLKIQNNVFKNIKARDMLITSDTTNYPDETYTGEITITGNTSIEGEERFIRASLNNSDAIVVITGNTIIDYKGQDPDYIKVSDGNNVTIENNTCSYTVSTVDKLKSVLSNAVDNVIIKLAGVNFGNVDLYNSTNNGHRYNYANYEAKNVKIVGENGATFSKLRLGENDFQPTMTGWTFENITFIGEGLQISMNNENVLVDNCKFNNSELLNTGTDTYKATNFTVKECSFDGSRPDNRKTQMVLQNNNGVKIYGCTFKNSEYSAINMTKIYGTVEIADNIINHTADRPFRFVVAATGATLNISDNTVISDGDSDGELMKVTADSGITVAESNITLSGNSWNGKSDAEVSSGIVGSAYIVK